MNNLQDDFFSVSAYFIDSIPEPKRDAASKALNKLIWVEVLPSAGPLEELQRCNTGGGPAIEASFEEKLLYLLHKFEDDNDTFCRLVLMLIKVFRYLKSQYPEFRLPIGFFDADYSIHVTNIFQLVSDRLSIKAYQDLLKEFFTELVEEWQEEFKVVQVSGSHKE